jgi:hypothetical protein
VGRAGAVFNPGARGDAGGSEAPRQVAGWIGAVSPAMRSSRAAENTTD